MITQCVAVYFFVGAVLYFINSFVKEDRDSPTLKAITREVLTWPTQVWPLSLIKKAN